MRQAGRALMDQGKQKEACGLVRRAVKEDPLSWKAWVMWVAYASHVRVCCW